MKIKYKLKINVYDIMLAYDEKEPRHLFTSRK